MDAQYFNLDNWDDLSSKYPDEEIWKINERFLDIQTSSGREIYLSHYPDDYLEGDSFYTKEIHYLIDNGYRFVDEGESGMLLDKVLDIFSDIFGKDIFLTEKQIAVEHMGFFKIKYRYLPLEYDIILENDRGVFSIEIYDNEGAHRNLYGIKNIIVQQEKKM